MSEKFQLCHFEGLNPIDSGVADDIIISSASFESRSTSTARALGENYSAEYGFIYVNQDEMSQRTEQNLRLIKNKLSEVCENIRVIDGSRRDQGIQIQSIKSALDPLLTSSLEDPTVTLDSTTFTRESLLTMLSVLYDRCPDARTRVTYVTPEEHGDWLSRGYNSIRNILGFAGLHDPAKPTALVVLSGFESQRTTKVIKEFEPTKLLLGVGDPPTKEKFLSRNQQEQKIVRERQDHTDFKFPTTDISRAKNQIQGIIEEYSDTHNIVIAPMSTKLSTIGAWEAARNHGEVQITYLTPDEYNENQYSAGEDLIYVDHLSP